MSCVLSSHVIALLELLLHTGRGHEMYATLGHVGHELMGKGGADSAEVVLLSVRVRPFVYLDVF